MNWFHPQEEFQVGALERYEDGHPGSVYHVKFEDGEEYFCEFFTGYESENTGDLDIEMEDPRYDEFYQIWLKVVRTINPGTRGSNTALTIDYRDFPTSIIDADTGVVVYPAPAPSDTRHGTPRPR